MDIIRKLKNTLTNSGLTEDEISFYIQVLKNPNSSIFDVAKRSKTPKDRAYNICNLLEEKGLLEADNSRKHKKIKAAPLNSYIEKLHSQGRKFHQTADSLKEVKPFLKFLSLPEEKGNFETFGEEEIGERFVDLTYLSWDQIFALGNFEMALPIMGKAPDEQFVSRRLKRGGRAYPILFNPGEYSLNVIAKNDYKEFRETKFVYTDKLSNYFIMTLPETDTTSIWIKDENGLISGATIKSSLLTKLHQDIYDYFSEIAEGHQFSRDTEN